MTVEESGYRALATDADGTERGGGRKGAPRFQVAHALYAGVTALDVIGPYEILSRWPNATSRSSLNRSIPSSPTWARSSCPQTRSRRASACPHGLAQEAERTPPPVAVT
jgi:hypothetical protein